MIETAGKILNETEISSEIDRINKNSKIELDTNKIILFLFKFNMIGAIWLPEKLHFIIRTIFKKDSYLEAYLKNGCLYFLLCASIISDCSSLTFDEIGFTHDMLKESINDKIKAYFTDIDFNKIDYNYCDVDLEKINRYCLNKYAYITMTSGVEI